MPEADAAEAEAPPASIGGLLDWAAAALRAAGIAAPRLEARLLLGHALGCDPARLLAGGDTPLADHGFRTLVRRRVAREPVAYILGQREFWGMAFRVTPAVLVPRPETETLLELALAALPDRAAVRRILDLGTGSGCLLVAALTEFPAATGLGIDASAEALRLAEANAQAHGLGARTRFRQGDWLAGVVARFDLVLANPPYLAAGELTALAPELGFEPEAALLAGEDGLGAYRAITARLAAVLQPEGIAILELGAGQAAAVAALAAAAGLVVGGIRHDLAGIARAMLLRRASAPSAAGVGNRAAAG